MKPTLAILTLMIAFALSGIFAITMAQSGSVQHDHSGQQSRNEKRTHSMMSRDGVGGMIPDKGSMSAHDERRSQGGPAHARDA